jgi:hypothetical protein
LAHSRIAVTVPAGAAGQLVTAPEGIRVVISEDAGPIRCYLGEQFPCRPALSRCFRPTSGEPLSQRELARRFGIPRSRAAVIAGEVSAAAAA